MTRKVYAINLGSSSTKVAYAEDGMVLFKESIAHCKEDFAGCESFFDQEPMRKAAVLANMEEHGIDPADLDAIIARGGMLQPLPTGVYEINDAMVAQLKSCAWGRHPSSMGSVIAREIAEDAGTLALTADVPSSDEMLHVARYTGLPGMWRRTITQTLNARAMVREWAERHGKAYDDVNAITTGLGGGINTIAHCHGRMVDTNNSVDGEGCFSTNRCLTVPIDKLIADCYSGKWDHEAMMQRVSGNAGLMGYLGTMDMVEIEERIKAGDTLADEVVDAMCYQVAKDIGAFSTTLRGDIDVIILSGGMANSSLVTSRIIERVSWIAPVWVRPGEKEMEALCDNAFAALDGTVPIREFVPAADEQEATGRIDALWEQSCWQPNR